MASPKADRHAGRSRPRGRGTWLSAQGLAPPSTSMDERIWLAEDSRAHRGPGRSSSAGCSTSSYQTDPRLVGIGPRGRVRPTGELGGEPSFRGRLMAYGCGKWRRRDHRRRAVAWEGRTMSLLEGCRADGAERAGSDKTCTWLSSWEPARGDQAGAGCARAPVPTRGEGLIGAPGQHPEWAVEMLALFWRRRTAIFDCRNGRRSGATLQRDAGPVAGQRSMRTRPDVVVAQGDTSSAFAGPRRGICGIPLVHVEAGLRSEDR